MTFTTAEIRSPQEKLSGKVIIGEGESYAVQTVAKGYKRNANRSGFRFNFFSEQRTLLSSSQTQTRSLARLYLEALSGVFRHSEAFLKRMQEAVHTDITKAQSPFKCTPKVGYESEKRKKVHFLHNSRLFLSVYRIS